MRGPRGGMAITRAPTRLDGGICRLDGSLTMLSKVKRFLESEDGPTATEYAIMLALIILVCITAVQQLGQAQSAKFLEVDAVLQ